MTPLIAIQILGLVYKAKQKRLSADEVEETADVQVIEEIIEPVTVTDDDIIEL